MITTLLCFCVIVFAYQCTAPLLAPIFLRTVTDGVNSPTRKRGSSTVKSHSLVAPEVFSKAEGSLQMAENSLASKADRNAIISTDRQTAQFSEDARILAVQRQEEERIAKERDDAAAKRQS